MAFFGGGDETNGFWRKVDFFDNDVRNYCSIFDLSKRITLQIYQPHQGDLTG
jgi:hypothetical protein